ncbi:DNA topoisomerase-like protein 2 [Elsinoe australis]|uniref:DNA topoisomerase 2 n=1 Tax=Elsinoe australis TaxID=40998 RepID=A0A4U7AXP4_9PEZI|nr:DNA topoisomerase-like protein 2 [Elsinoe australis]
MDSSMFSDGDGSDFDVATKPKPKKAPAAKPKAASKAASKAAPKKQSTLKVTKAPKKRAVSSDEENSDDEDTSLEDDSVLSNTPPTKLKKAPAPKKSSGKPLQQIANESFNETMDSPKSTPKGAKKAGNSDKYQKLTQLEHILKRPDTYIGSVERMDQQMWVFNSTTEQMEQREVSYVPGLYKIFDEILVNAADNKQNDKNMNEIRVWVDKEKGMIAVRNNGRGIPIEVHDKEQIYIPEMIFGHLLTGSNYNDDQAKVTGGRNGYGAKLCNIFSTQFTLETVDSRKKQKYTQTWKNNMGNMGKASIVSHKGEDYTKITFYPDFKKFNMDEMDNDFEALVKRRVYDMAGTCTGVKVYLNDERIKISKFKSYMEMYTKAIKTDNIIPGDIASNPETQVILTDKPDERWEIGFAVSDGSFQQVSFVNSIATTSGGTHVNYVADQIVNKLAEVVKKKNKGGVALKPAQIKNHMFLFVNCLVVNPAFSSQTKEQLTTKSSQFGSKCTVSEKFLKDIAKTAVIQNILEFAQKRADQVLKKSDGSKRSRIGNSKLTEANWAGTRRGWECTLILTEGDSASLLALAGRAVVGPDQFGVFPLRGKMLNVRDATVDQISRNAEIQNIKKFIGLQHKKDYKDTKELRYGHIMIMTDQDHDGSHIKGLLINWLQCHYPSLLKIPGFLLEFITPIVKVWKGNAQQPKAKRDFFTIPEYEAWKQLPGNTKGWEHKYFKGLGTNETTDAEIYFADLDKHLKEFHTMQEHEHQLIDLAFSKKKADERKMWLQNFVPGTYLDMSGTDKITYDDFINKELILFSMADNQRSIPSLVDGFKPGQRKVLYTCFRLNLKKDQKVVSLAGSIMSLTAYSYGDTSLQQTIVGLAQNFVGSNNINTLEPSGNFGSRLQGGSDAASPRYIYTRLSPFARRIFHAHDEALLTYNTDDGKTIEPETYVPIIPMILVNGADGIGTGWSTQIPNYNPEDIIENLKLRMKGSKEDMLPMKPWFRGFKGEISELPDRRYKINGIHEVDEVKNEVIVTELPVRQWTQDMKDRLEANIKAEKQPATVKDYQEYNTPTNVHFIIKMIEKNFKEAQAKPDGFENEFKLSKTMSATNLVAFDGQGRIAKYETVLDMMEEFYHIRLDFYTKRKAYLLGEMNRELEKLSNQARFIKMIIENKLVVSKKKKAVLVQELQKLGFKRIPKISDAKKQGELEKAAEDDNDNADENEEEQELGAGDYDYLLGMAIWSLTAERVAKLLQQIGDKEQEINVLTAKSPKDLWTEDLDALLEEWRLQLDEEKKKVQKIRAKGRRQSAKLGVSAKGRKRKADESDDSDFDFGPKKKNAKGNALSKSVLGKGGLDSWVASKQTAAPAKGKINVEGEPIEKAPAEKAGFIKPTATSALKSMAPPPKVKKEVKKEDSDVDMVDAQPDVDATDDMDVAPSRPAGRQRTAAKKMTYTLDDSDEESNDVFHDVEDVISEVDEVMQDTEEVVTSRAPEKPATKPASKPAPKAEVKKPSKPEPVKAAPAKTNGRAAAAQKKYDQDDDEDSFSDNDLGDLSAMVKTTGAMTSKPLISAERPSSGHGLSKKLSTTSFRKPTALSSDDKGEESETNYDLLSPKKDRTKTIRNDGFDDEDDSLLNDTLPGLKKPLQINKTKVADKAKINGTTAAKPKKEVARKPSASAAAPKVQTLSPAAKAYAKKHEKAKEAAPKTNGLKTNGVKGKKKVDSDEEDIVDDLLSDEDDVSPVAKKPAARPARRAAPAKGKYKVAMSSDAEEDEEESASEADFDGDESFD